MYASICFVIGNMRVCFVLGMYLCEYMFCNGYVFMRVCFVIGMYVDMYLTLYILAALL